MKITNAQQWNLLMPNSEIYFSFSLTVISEHSSHTNRSHQTRATPIYAFCKINKLRIKKQYYNITFYNVSNV